MIDFDFQEGRPTFEQHPGPDCRHFHARRQIRRILRDAHCWQTSYWYQLRSQRGNFAHVSLRDFSGGTQGSGEFWAHSFSMSNLY